MDYGFSDVQSALKHLTAMNINLPNTI